VAPNYFAFETIPLLPTRIPVKWMYPRIPGSRLISTDNGDNFHLEVNDGSGWDSVRSWVMRWKADWNNNGHWNEVDGFEFDMSGGMDAIRLRFRNNGDGNREKIDIDNVRLSGWPLNICGLKKGLPRRKRQTHTSPLPLGRFVFLHNAIESITPIIHHA
jgi:hypothetical protein